MEIPTESWNPEDFINELSIHCTSQCSTESSITLKKLFWENMTGKVLNWKPLSLQCTSTKNTLKRYILLSTSLSKCFHLWYVLTLPYSILIFSLCSQASLLKARVGNMTHVVQSFQLLCYSNKQLLCATPHPPTNHHTYTPPNTRAGMLRGQACFAKANTRELICQATVRHDLANKRQ